MTIDEDINRDFDTDDFYVALGVAHDSSYDEIKRAYLSKSLEFHPDRINDPAKKDEYNRKFQTISKIYQTLSDPLTRAQYDRRYETVAYRQFEPRICEEVSLSDCSESETQYYYDCRCSGKFALDKNQLNSNSTDSAFIIDCDTCSNSIKIYIR